MKTIEPESAKLVVTMKQVIVAVLGLLGGTAAIAGVLGLVGWNVLTTNLSGVQEDIKDVRADIRGLSGTDKDTTDKSSVTEISLRELIASLDKNIFGMRGDLAAFTKATDGQLQVINTNFSEMKDNWDITSTAVTAISARLLRIEESIGVSPSPQDNNPPSPAPKFDEAPKPDLSPAPLLPEP